MENNTTKKLDQNLVTQRHVNIFNLVIIIVFVLCSVALVYTVFVVGEAPKFLLSKYAPIMALLFAVIGFIVMYWLGIFNSESPN